LSFFGFLPYYTDLLANKINLVKGFDLV